MKKLSFFVLLMCVLFSADQITAQNLLLNPPTPTEVTVPEFKNTYVNDYGDLLSDGEENLINKSLRQYEDTTSNQIIVLTLKSYDNETFGPLFDYSHRVFSTWGIGQKSKNNGLLLVVVKKLSSSNAPGIRIITGYGLEGSLPDITCEKIAESIRPLINEGNYKQGIVQAIDKMQVNIKDEYKAVAESSVDKDPLTYGDTFMWIIAIFFVFIIFYMVYRLFFRNNDNEITTTSNDYHSDNNYRGLSRKYRDKDRNNDSSDNSLLAASFISYSDNDSSSSYSGDSGSDSGCDCGGGCDGGGGGGD